MKLKIEAELRPPFLTFLQILPVVLPVTIAAGVAICAFMAGATGSAYKAITTPG
jgi:hypothetical protein